MVLFAQGGMWHPVHGKIRLCEVCDTVYPVGTQSQAHELLWGEGVLGRVLLNLFRSNAVDEYR